MKTKLIRVLKFFSFVDVFDLLGAGALYAIIHGTAMIARSTAWIVGGSVLLVYAVLSSAGGVRRPRR